MGTSVCLSREPGRRSTGGFLLFVLAASRLAWVGFLAVYLQLEDAYACFEDSCGIWATVWRDWRT